MERKEVFAIGDTVRAKRNIVFMDHTEPHKMGQLYTVGEDELYYYIVNKDDYELVEIIKSRE